MKTEISSLELYYLLKELQHLVSAKVEQIYQIGKEELIIQFHIPSIGKQILRVILGKLMYIASNKGDVPEKPHGFCLFLRRKLKNSRLRQLKQLGFERIVEFLFETKDAKFRLIIELFSKGNIILCNEEGIIISALEQQEWKDRTVKPKQQYIYPKKEYNFLVIEKNELTELLHTSKKENLVKTLAIDLGLGGVYAEELCMIAKIDKNLKSNQLSDTEIDSIHSAIQTLSSKEMSPQIIYTSQEKKSIKDLTPFKLEFNKDLPSDPAHTFNAAFDSILTKKIEA
ncbi:NFACT family protein, partial [Candidatus Woesearchaeota archaeon]|nr:NFACT family protein [Candidatus Woesearchaeota archaeon]